MQIKLISACTGLLVSLLLLWAAEAQVEGTEAPSIPRQTMLVLVATPIEQADAELILEVAKREEAETVKSVAQQKSFTTKEKGGYVYAFSPRVALHTAQLEADILEQILRANGQNSIEVAQHPAAQEWCSRFLRSQGVTEQAWTQVEEQVGASRQQWMECASTIHLKFIASVSYSFPGISGSPTAFFDEVAFAPPPADALPPSKGTTKPPLPRPHQGSEKQDEKSYLVKFSAPIPSEDQPRLAAEAFGILRQLHQEAEARRRSLVAAVSQYMRQQYGYPEGWVDFTTLPTDLQQLVKARATTLAFFEATNQKPPNESQILRAKIKVNLEPVLMVRFNCPQHSFAIGTEVGTDMPLGFRNVWIELE